MTSTIALILCVIVPIVLTAYAGYAIDDHHHHFH